jgi:hypothetical protein
MNINPNALLLWGACFLGGYLIGGSVQIGLWALLGGFCVSLLASFWK